MCVCVYVTVDSSEEGRIEDDETKLILLKKLLYDLGIDYIDNPSVFLCVFAHVTTRSIVDYTSVNEL